MSSEIKSTTVQTNSLKDKTGTRTLASDSGSAWSWGANVPVGTTLQTVGIMDSDVDTTTDTIPSDDTIPQNNEGKEAFTLDITPFYANSKLLIHCFVGCISNSDNNRRAIISLFKDSDANAIAASYADFQDVGTGEQGLDLTHFMTAGSSGSPITFKVRFGSSGSGTTTLNGSGSSRLMGGVMATGMTITEIKV